jgi:hypothetical protein
MKGDMVSHDARAVRLASKLRRRIRKKAGKLKARLAADPGQSHQTERARRAALAVSKRLKELIATLEARRFAVERLSGESRHTA